MDRPLRILVLEDRATDAEVLIREVKQAGFNPEWRRVETEAEFLAELAKAPELILSDYSLPHFDGLSAVKLLRERGLDTPFILVSGTLGEEAAVAAMKLGVDDYLLKDRIVRVGEAIKRVLEEKRLRDDRKLAEENLVRLNERFALATRAASLGIWDWDVPKNKLVWDDRMFEFYGVPREDFSGAYEAWLKGLHPEDAARCEAETQSALRGETEYNTEFRVVWPDGSIRHLRSVAQVLRDAHGQPLRMTGINYDITARKLAEDAVRESEQRFRGTFEQAAVGMAHVSIEGRFLRVNDKLCAILGYAREELLELTFADLTLPEHLAESLEARRAMMAGEQAAYSSEKRYRRKGGEGIWVRLVTALERTPAREPRYFISVFVDITVRKQAEQQVADQLAELRRWQAVMLDRTDRSMELKREVNALLVRLGEPIRYSSQPPEPPKA